MKRTVLFLVALTVCSAALSAGKTNGESIDLKSAQKTVLNVTVDGTPVKVTRYVDHYVTKPNRPQDQKINIYIPTGATKASPIMFYVNNAGWQANTYPENTITDGQDYDGTTNKVGVALREGYVVVSYGGRSRSNGLTDGKYLGHSPAIMVDTKAAIRYLRFNKKALPAGDTVLLAEYTTIYGCDSIYTLYLSVTPATPTALDAIRDNNAPNNRKIYINGQIYIRRDGQLYTPTGVRVR